MGIKTSILQQPPKARKSDPVAPPVAPRSLTDVLFTATQKKLFGLLFGQPGRSFFVTQLIELAGVGRGAVQRELAALEYSGLILTERRGNRKHCRANPDAPIYRELCSIVSKTVGVPEQLRTALEPIESKMTLALIYGSVARQADSAASDIDLLVVSDELTLEDLYSSLVDTEERLGRQIAPALYTVGEFNDRRASDNAFLRRVLDGPTFLLKGSLDAA